MAGRAAYLICALSVLSLAGVRCAKPRDCCCRLSSESAATPAADAPTGTLIIFQCDKPDEVGKRDRAYKAEITTDGFWEEFQIPISQDGGTVRLRNNFPVGETVMIRFVVPEEPDFPTKYSRAEWFYRGRTQKSDVEPGKSILFIPFSRFRNLDRLARTLQAP